MQPRTRPPHPATLQRREAQGALPTGPPPHPATSPRSAHERPPHPATIIQQRSAPFGATTARPPHPATVIQRRSPPFGAPTAPPPHPAKVIQRAAERVDPLGDFQGLLEPAEFNKLADHGFIDPRRLRFAQGGVTIAFSHPEDTTVFSLADDLKSGKVKASAIPPVEIGEFAQHIWSFDTRRLLAFQMAGVPVPYVKIRAADVLAKLGNFDFVGTRMGKRLLVRFAGIHQPGKIHENPAFRTAEHDKIVGALPPTSEDMVNAGTLREFDSALKILTQVATPDKNGFTYYPPKKG